MAELVQNGASGQYSIIESNDVSTTGVLQHDQLPGNGSTMSTPLGVLGEDGFGRYMSAICVAVVTIFTIVGNIGIIMCVSKSRTLNSTNYSVYVMSLAYSDLAVGVIIMPRMVMLELLGIWPLGKMFCVVYSIVDYSLYSVSMLHLCAIAYDRLYAVAHPLQYRSQFTRGRAMKISAVIWVICTMVWIPPNLVTMLPDALDNNIIQDRCIFQPKKIPLLFLAILGYYLFIIAMVFMYILLLVVLKRRNVGQAETKQELEVGGKQSDSNTKGKVTIHDVTSQESAKMSGQNKRAINTLGVLIFVVVICWTPWAIFWPIKRGYCKECISNEVYTASMWLLYVNSCLNPYLYFMFNLDFRKAFVQIFSQPN